MCRKAIVDNKTRTRRRVLDRRSIILLSQKFQWTLLTNVLTARVIMTEVRPEKATGGPCIFNLFKESRYIIAPILKQDVIMEAFMLLVNLRFRPSQIRQLGNSYLLH